MSSPLLPHPTRRRLLALTVVLALGAVACGDDTTTGTTAETTAPEDTAAPTTSEAPTTTAVAAAEIVVDPEDPQLVGFAPGEQAEPVIQGLTAALGEPTSDSDWAPTECPPLARARSLAWGNLVAYFDGSSGTDLFTGWIYDTTVDRPAGPGPDEVTFTDGLTWSSTLADVSSAFGTPGAETSLGTLVVVGPVTYGFEIGAVDTAPLEKAWVGPIPTCS